MTVFAPTNEAFSTALLQRRGLRSFDALLELPSGNLAAILKIHIVTSGAVYQESLRSSGSGSDSLKNVVMTAEGASLSIVSDGFRGSAFEVDPQSGRCGRHPRVAATRPPHARGREWRRGARSGLCGRTRTIRGREWPRHAGNAVPHGATCWWVWDATHDAGWYRDASNGLIYGGGKPLHNPAAGSPAAPLCWRNHTRTGRRRAS